MGRLVCHNQLTCWGENLKYGVNPPLGMPACAFLVVREILSYPAVSLHARLCTTVTGFHRRLRGSRPGLIPWEAAGIKRTWRKLKRF